MDRAVIAGVLQAAASLPFIVAATTIGVDMGSAEQAGLIAAMTGPRGAAMR
jgi:hypothetical protein